LQPHIGDPADSVDPDARRQLATAFGPFSRCPPLTTGPTGAPFRPMLKKSPLTAANVPARLVIVDSGCTAAIRPGYSRPARSFGSLRSTRIANASVASPRAGSRRRMSVVPGPTAHSLAIAATRVPALGCRAASPVVPPSVHATLAGTAAIITVSSLLPAPAAELTEAINAPSR